MCLRTGRPASGKVPIIFGTYNICNGHNGGLEAALRGMPQDNIDLGILQETKLTDGIYTRGLAGYSVVATDAPIQHHGGVAISTARNHTLRSKRWRSLGPTSSVFSSQQGRGGGTLWACTSNLDADQIGRASRLSGT